MQHSRAHVDTDSAPNLLPGHGIPEALGNEESQRRGKSYFSDWTSSKADHGLEILQEAMLVLVVHNAAPRHDKSRDLCEHLQAVPL